MRTPPLAAWVAALAAAATVTASALSVPSATARTGSMREPAAGAPSVGAGRPTAGRDSTARPSPHPVPPALALPDLHAARSFASARPAALPAGQKYVCPPARPGWMQCMSIIRGKRHVGTATGTGTFAPAATSAGVPGYGPVGLQSAYKIAAAAASKGRGVTVAIVDAFNDPHAASDLAAYRAHFRLGRCGTTHHCLRIVNEYGNASPLPHANGMWAAEESLDLDMVSAVCPRCHILLVEATNNSTHNLGRAENTAIRLGAKYVSNSWSGPEFPGQDFFDRFFIHPGAVIDVAAGDNAYTSGQGAGFAPAQYPTDLQFVTAVGGTTLRHASNVRGWSETAWGTASGLSGTGSGCSVIEAKPSWQTADGSEPNGCLNRTGNDVAAVANPNTGVAVYDTYPSPVTARGWNEGGGTSASTPIITAVYALAGTPTPRTYPAQYPYLHTSALFDVRSGATGTCEPNRKYLCNAEPGYDGPTGLGTPDGTAAFTNGGARQVTVVDPGTQDIALNKSFSLTINSLDSAGVAVSYPSGVLLPGLTISSGGVISGTPTVAGTYPIDLTATDGTVSGSTHFDIVVVPSLRASGAPGHVTISSGKLCLDDGTGTPGAPVTVQACHTAARQSWSYQALGGPDDVGTFSSGGVCLGLSGTQGVAKSCNGAADQQWQYLGFGVLGNLGTGMCLATPVLAAGTQVIVKPCIGSQFQAWALPPGPLTSGTATPACLDGSGGAGAQVTVQTCGPATGQQWAMRSDGSIRVSGGLCLDAQSSLLDATSVVANPCVTSGTAQLSQLWVPSLSGELINIWSGRCLADPANGGPGTGLTQQDCYGHAGEVWGLNG